MAKLVAISGSVSPFVLLMMSFANISGVSSIPAALCSLVFAPGINPVDIAVVPNGVESLSMTRTSELFSFADKAADRPQPPAPTTTIGIEYSNSL